MRKILGFLVAAVFVATVAGSAMAQTVIKLSTPIGGASAKASFEAEVVFTVSGDFGFVLKRAQNNALPASGDKAATKVDWFAYDEATLTVAPGVQGFKNSQVYAEVENDLMPGTSVQFYTANATSTNAEYTINGSSPMYVNPLIESAAGLATANDGLPLAYVFVSSETVFDVAISTHLTANASALTSVGGVHIMDADGKNPSYYAFFVKDKARIDRPVDHQYAGQAADTGYNKKDATIALNNATQRGNRALAKATTDPYYSFGTPTGEFWYVPAKTAYMFFSSNFENAVGGFKYGTDTLTLEMTVDGGY